MTAMVIPTSDVDLFADEHLDDPYPVHRDLRDQGASVWLTRHRVWAIPRYAEVRDVLRDHERFSSASGVGLNPEANAMRKGTIIATDPPEHTVLRSILADRLVPRALRSVRADIEARAVDLVDRLVARTEFDAVADLARRFPLDVVADLIGLPEEGRDQLLPLADSAFNSFGPLNDRGRAGLDAWARQRAYLQQVATRDRLRPGGFGADLYEAADRGLIDPQSSLALMGAYLTAGMDTTVNTISSAIWLLADHPDQWQLVRTSTEMLRAAVNEVLRMETPVQAFARVTTTDVELDGVHVPAGERVVVLYGSANRDERKWRDPDRFDITRNPVDHVGFGYGAHGCAGQGLARIEIEALLAALAQRVERFEAGRPVRHLNNVIRGLERLPVRLVVA
ncbi:cytochrome P450 [Streptomyces sp. NPDC057257]|uniref:cytochrome P450 n=1 Tax=Streptomyces sp. NPDC057257 TaxID=3346071 RepID=UPI00362C764C